jgi:hypothetical protein
MQEGWRERGGAPANYWSMLDVLIRTFSRSSALPAKLKINRCNNVFQLDLVDSSFATKTLEVDVDASGPRSRRPRHSRSPGRERAEFPVNPKSSFSYSFRIMINDSALLVRRAYDGFSRAYTENADKRLLRACR